VSAAKHALGKLEGTQKEYCHFDPFGIAQDKLREKSFLDPSSTYDDSSSATPGGLVLTDKTPQAGLFFHETGNERRVFQFLDEASVQ
jgi:hypothetical protein